MKNEGRIESIRQSLLNRSKERGVTFDYILIRYGIERLLYRLAASDASERFVLKGASLFHVWNEQLNRPTRDLDLLGYGSDDLQSLREVMLDVLSIQCPEDGLSFDEDSLKLEEIREAASYGGVRIKLRAMLGSVRIPIQVDVGFGDAITPAPETHDYPAMLPDMPTVRINTYPIATVIAEKFEALVRLDALNTRMKDYFDLDYLLTEGGCDQDTLKAAIEATFLRRSNTLPSEVPTGLTESFATNRSAMWRAYLAKNGLKEVPFGEVVSNIRGRLEWVWNS